MIVDKRVDERLRSNDLIWLVTVNAAGDPKPTLVWYWWDGAQLLVYSREDKPKLLNISANPSVALHLDAERDGHEEVTVITGNAHVDESIPSVVEHSGYAAKYEGRITGELHMSVGAFSDLYCVPIVIRPQAVRAW